MSDFDLTPPALPGSQQEEQGFLKRLFKKKGKTDGPAAAAPYSPATQPTEDTQDTHQPTPATAASPGQFDLDEIKRKLGLDDDAQDASAADPLTSGAPSPSSGFHTPAAPRPQVMINDWTSEAPLESMSAAISDIAQPPSAAVSARQPWDAVLDITQGDTLVTAPEATAQPRPSASASANAASPSATQKATTGRKNEGSAGQSAWAQPDGKDENAGNADDAETSVPGAPAAAEGVGSDATGTAAQETPAHHEAVDAHFAQLDKAHDQITRAIKAISDERPNIPEWRLQQQPVPPEEYFFLHNGQPVRSLKELIEAIDYIDDTTFAHHVNEYRNDFANWIRDVIRDPDLAAQVQDTHNRDDMLRELLAHQKSAQKQLIKENEQLQKSVEKRKETVKKLLGVNDRIDALQEQLSARTKELSDERKRSTKLIKDKLDIEVAKRLAAQKGAFETAKAELLKAKQVYLTRIKEYDAHIKSLKDRDDATAQGEEKLAAARAKLKEERLQFSKEKETAAPLLKEAESVRKQLGDIQKTALKNKQALDDIARREAAIARAEETLHAKEKKLTADLTAAKAEEEKLAALRAEHGKRELAVKKAEADAAKLEAESDSRSKEALAVERSSRERIRADMKRLETLRSQIEKTLSKALGQKRKISDAVALRKHLEESILKAKQDIVKERSDLDAKGYDALAAEKEATSPVGQIVMEDSDDVLSVKHTDLYGQIEACRAALERRDLPTAKSIYTRLRDEYGNAKLGPTERQALYNSIRELYDDIHLMMLG